MNRRLLLRYLTGTCLLVFLRFWPLFFGSTVAFGDNFSLMVPGKLFTAHWLQQGILPLWNPTLLAGIPWLADSNQSVLYPSTLLFMLLRPAVAVNATILGHLVVTFLGMAILARQFSQKLSTHFLAATLWTLSPQITATLNNLASLQSLSLLPWVVLAGLKLERSKWWTVAFVGLVFLQWLGGYPQYVLYAVLTGVCFHAWLYFSSVHDNRRTAVRIGDWLLNWAFRAVIVLLTTAVLWWPFLEVLQNSTRAVQSLDQAATGSLQLYELSKIVFPYLFVQHNLGMAWGPAWNGESNIFLYSTVFGVLVIGLWLTSLQKKKSEWFLVGVAVISVVLAFGENVPGFSLLTSLPIISSARGTNTILCIAACAVSLLLSVVIERLSIKQATAGRIYWSILALGSAALLVFIAVRTQFNEIWATVNHLLKGRLAASIFHTLERDYVIASAFFGYGAISALFTSLLVFLWQRQRYWLLVVVIAMEMSFFTQMYFFYVPLSHYDAPKLDSVGSEILSQAELKTYRVLPRNYNAPYTDFGAYWEALTKRAPFTDSYVDATELAEMHRAEEMKQGGTPNWNQVQNVPSITGYTTLLPQDLAQEFATTSDRTGQPQGLGINRLDFIPPTHQSLSRWAVRYYLVDSWFSVEPEEVQQFKLLAEQGDWQLFELPNTLSRFRWSDGQAAAVSNLQETPNSIQFELTVAQESGAQSLIIADRYDRNWVATVNGAHAALGNADGQLELQLPPGTASVLLSYQPVRFIQGLWVSLLGVVLSLIWVGWTGLSTRAQRLLNMSQHR